MKYALTALLLATALALGGTAQAKDIKELMQDTKKPMTIKGGKSEKMDVVFNHTTHSGIGCIGCHHERADDGTRYVACTTCHETPGARERDPDSMFMAFHSKAEQDRSCYSCHNRRAAAGKITFNAFETGCRPCHMPQTAKADFEALRAGASKEYAARLQEQKAKAKAEAAAQRKAQYDAAADHTAKMEAEFKAALEKAEKDAATPVVAPALNPNDLINELTKANQAPAAPEAAVEKKAEAPAAATPAAEKAAEVPAAAEAAVEKAAEAPAAAEAVAEKAAEAPAATEATVEKAVEEKKAE